MNIDFIKKMLEIGFNCMPINANKTPVGKWSNYQEKKINSLSEFHKQTDFHALITGFNDVECIDVDLKVIEDFDERKKFKKDLFNLLDDNIEDFYSKVVIKKTRSDGYHIIYRAKNIDGNQKLAKINGYKEAVIETRGVGGYICMYDGIIKERDYHNIQLISDEEREIIISCCKTFHDETTKPIEPIPKRTEKVYSEVEITPWEDYNNKVSVWDLIGHEFSIVRNS